MATHPSATGWAALALSLGLAMTPPAAAAAAHSFPYVPTQILMPSTCYNASACKGRDVAYIFAPSGDNAAVQFLALNYSSGVADGAGPRAVTTELPFFKDAGKTTAFGAVRTGDGTVMVYAGACDGDTGSVWSYDPGPEGGTSAGWTRMTTTTTTAQQQGRGAYFLGGTLAFSTTLAPKMDQPTIYTYGGMCLSPQSSAATWQVNANYTKTMLSLVPAGDGAYNQRIASVGGPRVPFAGFTATQLPASMSNMSGTVTQQASFVFLGGHTQQAFINMSTAAIWNLPEESWSYVNVQPPEQQQPGQELAVKQLQSRADSNVYSRSGHTAVLGEDGRSVVVLGGWVGDVNTPAEPQLAVLEMSEAYSSWRWRIPSAQPEGAGIYGHGAALLPGNVMMVYGGWHMQSSGDKTRRQAASAAPRFLNLTSMDWSSSYANPNGGSSRGSGGDGSHSAPDEDDSSSKARRLSLGLGLGLGFAVLLGIVLGLLLWRIRQRRRQARHDEAVRAMAEDARHFFQDPDMAERDAFAWGQRDWRSGGVQDPYQQPGQSLGYESLAADRGAAGNVSMSGGGAIVRKPVARNLRAGYVPAETRFNAFISPPGVIHPILEDDEDEYNHDSYQHAGEPLTPTSEVHSDPFLTPTGASATIPPVLYPPGRGSATPSPDNLTRRHDPDVQGWVSDVDAADALLTKYNNNRQGRSSPTRRNSGRSTGYLRDDDSRTGSNLSESNRSAVDSLRRAVSGKRAAAAGFFAGAGAALLGGGAAAEHPKPGSSSSSSYNTARSGFGALQAEAPSLLMGGRTTPGSATVDDEDDEYANYDDRPGSPSKSRPRRGWLGSFRRVFSSSGSSSPTHAPSPSHDESPYALSGSDAEPRLTGGLSGLTGELLRRKQGRGDWEGSPSQQQQLQQQQPAQGENEWDIERAIEQRLVQVMFTVPRERLRVVNGEAGDNDDDDDNNDARSQHQPRMAELVDPSSQDSASSLRTDAPSPSRDLASTPSRDLAPTPNRDLAPSPDRGRDTDRDLLHVDEPSEPRRSHSTDGSGRRSSGAVFTAEAVTFERPRTRTRVRQMVDSIESRSPSSSPTREP